MKLSLRRPAPRARLLAAVLVAPLGATALVAPDASARVLAPAGSAATVAATTPTAAATGAPARPSAKAGSTRVARTWSAAYMADDHTYTAAEAKTMASRFDLVAALPYAFRGQVDTMRGRNKDLILLAYANATLANSSAYSGLPEAAFAHDARGNRITASGFGTKLMESSNPKWRARADQQCTERAATGGYDGCLVDMLTLGIFSKGFVSGLPIKPGTGKVYTQQQYRDQMVALSAYYRAHGPDLIEVGNSVENSYRYWQDKVPSRPLVGAQPASQMEDFMRGSGTDVNRYPMGADWVRNVRVITDMEAKGKMGLFSTKLWVGATDAQTRTWQAYAMATFMMGAGGRSYFAFTRSRDRAGVMLDNAPYRLPRTIGAPKGAMRKLGNGAYLRRFAKGAAVANPTSRTVKISLGATMTSLSGAVVRTVTLAPHSGDVLVAKASSSTSSRPSVGFTKASGAKKVLRTKGVAGGSAGISQVWIAVRDEKRKKWRKPGGSWGSYTRIPTNLGARGATRTGWVKTFTLPPRRYRVVATARDAAGRTSAVKVRYVKVTSG